MHFALHTVMNSKVPPVHQFLKHKSPTWARISFPSISSLREKFILVETSHEKCWIRPCILSLSHHATQGYTYCKYFTFKNSDIHWPTPPDPSILRQHIDREDCCIIQPTWFLACQTKPLQMPSHPVCKHQVLAPVQASTLGCISKRSHSDLSH